MPAFTPVYGWPYEHPVNDQPGITLSGGEFGTEPILAEAVEEDVSRIDSGLSAVDDRLTVVEGFGRPSWVQIQSGAAAGVSGFTIADIPVATYSRVRLTLWGDATTASDPIRLTINDDLTAAMHKSGLLVRDAAGTLISNTYADATRWNIAQWGTGDGCSAVIEIINTHVASVCAFMAQGERIGGSATAHTISRSWGRISSPRLLESLRVSAPLSGTFAANWWLEGAPV